jgi:hypothetical protein
MRLAMLSFADINNYGDIMFSHVFRMEMQKRNPNLIIDFYTPSEIELEGIKYKGYLKERIDNNYDAVVLAGGEVVHLFDERTWNPIYEKQNKKVLSAKPSDIVWEWSEFNIAFKAWFSIGVRPFGDKWDSEKISKTIKNLDYISTRGILSKKILEESNFEKFNSKINITPDLGWIFPDYIDFLDLRGKLYTKYINKSSNYLLFQVHNVTELEAKSISKKLSKIKLEHKLEVVLMPVIHLWKDEIYLQQINYFANEDFLVLPNNLSIIEMLDIIVNSKMVITSSLHVAITALADGIPASVFNKWQGSKLQDLFGLQFRTNALFSDISEFEQIIELLNDEVKRPNSIKLYSRYMKSKLSDVFDDFSNDLLKHHS